MSLAQEKMQSLRNTDIFSAVPGEQLAEIARALKSQYLKPNTVLFHSGEPGNKFYIVHSGKLRVFLTGEDGIESDLNRLGPGDCFGEMALLTGEPRSSNVETLEQTHLFVLTKEEFDVILGKHPFLYKNCIKHISKLLKKDESRILGELERENRTARLLFSDFVFIGIIVVLFAAIFNLSNPNGINVMPKLRGSTEFRRIDFADAKRKHDQGEAVFVDARPSNFYDESHIKGAINLPLPSFEINYMYMSEENKQKELIVYGRSIGALYDEEVAGHLDLFGHENVTILRGTKQYLPLRWFAFDTWKEYGFPVEGYGHE